MKERLRLGKANDGAERQADRAAAGRAVKSPAPPSIDHAAVVPDEVGAELARPGMPLPPGMRHRWERQLGERLDRVRVHDDAPAQASAAGIDAAAYTHGDHVVLGAEAGPADLGHELAHVVQQRAWHGAPVVQRNERQRREAQRMYDKNSVGATPEKGNPLVLFEDDMTKDLNEKLRAGDYGLITEAFDNVIVWYNDDDIAYNMAKQLSDEEMNALATRPAGRIVLQKLWDEMDSGSTDDQDRVQMARIQTALSMSITTPLVTIDDKGEITQKAGKDDWADRPWMQPDRIKDKDQVRVRADGTPTDNQGKALRPGDPGWDHVVATAKWTIEIPLAPLSNIRLLSVARFSEWLFANEPEKILGAGAYPKVGRRLGEVRDEMVRRIRERESFKKIEAAHPVAKMPDVEPDPIDHQPAAAPNPLEQLDRIRNMGGFGSFAMVVAIFADASMETAIAIGETADTMGNIALAAAARRRVGQAQQKYMASGGAGGGKPATYATGGAFGIDKFSVEPLPGKTGLSPSGPQTVDALVKQLKSGPPTYGTSGPQYEVTPEGFIRLRTNAPPLVIRLDGGTVIPLDKPGGMSPWIMPGGTGMEGLPPLKLPPGFGGSGTGAPAPKEMKPGVFINLVSTPQGKVMPTEELINGMYEKHPNRKAIEASLKDINCEVESKPTLAKERGASADVVMIDIVGPNGERFTRSRIRFQPGEATNQAFHHELNHLLDFQTGKIPRWERHISDPAEFAKAKTEPIDVLLKRPGPASGLNQAQGMARYTIGEIRNHLRDIAEYGMTAKDGKEVPANPGFAERQRDPTIQNYTSTIRQLTRHSSLDDAQRAELKKYVRQYINDAFPELPAEYTRLHHGKGNLWLSLGVAESE